MDRRITECPKCWLKGIEKDWSYRELILRDAAIAIKALRGDHPYWVTRILYELKEEHDRDFPVSPVL